jgi:MFS transporter, NNP family, nitrate/nitrite transporter
VFDWLVLMFAVPVDAKQGDRAIAMHWRSFKRPHMRIFYVSTFSYFTAFLAWFAFAPLLPEVRICPANLKLHSGGTCLHTVM